MKNFNKSLDHQGITFKNTDRKAISVKHLIQEIETIHLEQRHKKSNLTVQHQYDLLVPFSILRPFVSVVSRQQEQRSQGYCVELR